MTLQELQKKVKKSGLDALYVPMSNMFIGQDLVEEENNVFKLTGFSGSAGELVVMPDKVYLFTDGRYTLQAKNEVDENLVQVFSEPNAFGKFINNMGDMKIGFNPWTISLRKFGQFVRVMAVESDLLPAIHNIKTPKVFELKQKFAGEKTEEKLRHVLRHMNFMKADGYLITAADSVSWFLNLRSDYLPNSPVVRAFVLVDKSGEMVIFSNDMTKHKNYKVAPLVELEKVLKKYKNKMVNFDDGAPYALHLIAEKYKIKNHRLADIINIVKAQKNEVELEGMKNAHLKDGVALTKWMYWLENNWQGLSELDVVEKLYTLRKQQKDFFGNSFETIAGFAENGAIVHYRPNAETNKKLRAGSMLLLDSGGQYFDGTTDVTRTVAIGKVSSEMRHNYTLVLKAHIALAKSVFPDKTSGVALDTIARSVMWAEGKDYAHGTGHGVGHFLNVHEGPFSLSPRENGHLRVMENMITSIEPGYYVEGKYGIRIENLYVVKPAKFAEMLEFEPLTVVPIDTRMVDEKMLDDGELKWLKEYNRLVYKKIAPYLDATEKKWLKEVAG